MYLLELLLILLWLLIFPFIIGILITNQILKEKCTDLLLTYVCGFICMLAVFYILVMPLLFFNIPLHILVICWSTVMLILCVCSLILNRKVLKHIFRIDFTQFRKNCLLSILIIILVLGQAFVLVRYMHEDADDAFYVANATTSVATDTIFRYDPYTGELFNTYMSRYVFSPFPIFIALISKLIIIHPTIVAHTVLPAIFIPLSYIILALIGKKLFPQKTEAVMYFLLFLCVLNVFGNVSIYTNSSFLLFRIWQGKAVLANIVIPCIAYFSYRAMSDKSGKGEWLVLFGCVFSACLASSMGIVLAPIILVCLGLIFAVRNKHIQTFVYSILCCTPCIICGVTSLLIN